MNNYMLGYLLLIGALIISFYAQAKVNGAYRKYSRLNSFTGITGAEAARKMLNAKGLYNVEVREISGQLSDHFDPRDNSVNLSREIYEGSSIASIAVACHECGHAYQYAEGYQSLVIRNNLIPVFNFSQKFGYIAILIGFFSGFMGLINIGILLLCAMLVYHLLTLPVEFNASSRAMDFIDGIALQDDVYVGARKMLSAAAFTYVAAFLASLASILRLLLLTNNHRR